MNERMGGRMQRDREGCTGGLDWKRVWWLGGWPTQHSQWMRQPSVDLLTQTPQLMNQTWFPPVRRTPSLRLCARQNKAHLH